MEKKVWIKCRTLIYDGQPRKNSMFKYIQSSNSCIFDISWAIEIKEMEGANKLVINL